MGVSRELRETRENGIQVRVCSKCGWKRPYPRLDTKGEDSGDALLKEFVRHVCADFPRKTAPGREPICSLHVNIPQRPNLGASIALWISDCRGRPR